MVRGSLGRSSPFATLISERIGRISTRVDWSDGAAVAELLGPTLAYHRVLAGVAGGVNAGLLLSHAVYLTRIRSKSGSDGWVCRSAAHWHRELGLTRREQEVARRELARIGVWEEQVAGVPPRISARVRLSTLVALLVPRDEGEENGLSGVVIPRLPDCGISTNRLAPNGESSMQEPHILVLPEAPNQFRRNRHNSSAESAKLYVQRSTSTSVQQPHTREECRELSALHRGGDLVFPDRLLPEEQAAAGLLVRKCAHLSQALLDELAARLEADAVHTSPIGYLRGMVARALAGDFVAGPGSRIAAARRRSDEERVLRLQREADDQRLAAESATPEYQEKVVARKAQIAQLLAEMRCRTRPKPDADSVSTANESANRTDLT